MDADKQMATVAGFPILFFMIIQTIATIKGITTTTTAVQKNILQTKVAEKDHSNTKVYQKN
ncbi:hypothetical protein [Halobacillus trueperi]|uniref:hypothetical protein n=1 Tax=Halobacillus trueperi TaxID=156205 RepID=UPI002161D72B|nr:hypothetical protein [Halobacillus trueperi]